MPACLVTRSCHISKNMEKPTGVEVGPGGVCAVVFSPLRCAAAPAVGTVARTAFARTQRAAPRAILLRKNARCAPTYQRIRDGIQGKIERGERREGSRLGEAGERVGKT